MLVSGIALLVGAVLLAPLAYSSVRGWKSARDEAAVHPGTFADRAGETVTITGFARPGPAGVLESGLAGVDCVWHGHEVRRHYWMWQPRSDTGERERQRCWDAIADHTSLERFGISGPGQGTASRGNSAGEVVLVDPEKADTAGVHLCLQRVVGPPQRGGAAGGDDLLARVKGRISGVFRGETIEFEYREWAIRPGDPITVHGRIELREGHPVVVAPPNGFLRVEHSAPVAPARGGRRATTALALVAATVAALSVGTVLTVVAG